MRVLVQWSRASPKDWETLDAATWITTPTRLVPRGGEVLDSTPGWVTRLRTRNFDFCGYDHYAVEPIAGGGCRVTAWSDDPDDLDPTHEFYARVVEMWPCEPDPRLGGAWNAHRWNQVVYAGPLLTKFYADNPTMNTTVRPWSEFVPPAPEVTRHGVWMPDALMEEHDRAIRPVDWREWTEGVPAEFVRNGRIVDQRPLGRYDKPKGTKTFGLRDIDRASGAHVATHEDEMTLDAFGAGEVEDVTQVGGASILGWVWSSFGEPNDADWPSGNYRCSLDVSAAGADQSFGLRTAGTETGHFARATSSADLETFPQIEALFTGAQIHVATTGTIDPAAGADTERFECLVAITRAASHGNQTTTMRYSADAFADGPWSAAGPQTLTPSAVSAAFSTPTPTLVKGAVTLTPTAVAGSFSTPAPTLVLGGVTLTPAAIATAWGVQTPTLVLGGVTLVPDPVTGAWSIATPTISTAGAQTMLPDAVTAALSVPTPTVLVGGVTITPAAVLMQMQTQIPGILLGGVTLTPDPAVFSASIPSPQILAGPILITPDAVAAVWSVPVASLLTGGVTLLVDPVTATFGVLVPILEGGEQTEGGSTHRPRHFAMYLGLWGGGTREPQ